MAGEVDESVTGSANFFGPKRLRAGPASTLRPRRWTSLRAHQPSVPGFQALLWGVLLGAYIWIGGLAIGVGGGTAFLFGLIGAVLIFFYVRLYGEDQLRR